MTNSTISDTFLKKKEEREELLLLKCVMVWIKFRFQIPMKFNVKKDDIKYVQELQKVDNLKKVAIISDEDAWTLEKNAFLLNIIGRKVLNEIVTDDLFQKFGSVITSCNRKESIVNIALVSTVDKDNTPQVMPCSLVIMNKSDIVTQFKKTDTVIQPNHVDMVPFLKIKIPSLLTKNEIQLIESAYYEYKDKDTVKKDREKIIADKVAEDNNLKAIIKAIGKENNSNALSKLAITLHTLVTHSYKVDPQRVSKIKYGSNGASPVMNFSRLYYVNYDVDLNMMKEILDPIMDQDINIRVHNNRILFTTGRYDPEDDVDMETLISTTIDTVDDLEKSFKSCIGSMASIFDVKKIIKQVISGKDKNITTP
jgi:hypothetical protein